MSKLIQYERKQLILEQLRGSELAHIEDLVDTTGASPSTVRRDIDALVKSGRVIAPPSTDMTNTSSLPCRREAKAMRCPSGDHTGWWL